MGAAVCLLQTKQSEKIIAEKNLFEKS